MKGQFAKVFETQKLGQILVRVEPHPDQAEFLSIEFDSSTLIPGGKMCRADVQMPEHTRDQIQDIFTNIDTETALDMALKLGQSLMEASKTNGELTLQ